MRLGTWHPCHVTGPEESGILPSLGTRKGAPFA